jgi:hypothetical protein
VWCRVLLHGEAEPIVQVQRPGARQGGADLRAGQAQQHIDVFGGAGALAQAQLQGQAAF